MTGQKASNELRVAIAGLGSIGSKIATALDQGIEGLVLSAVAVRDSAKHQAFLNGLRRPPQILPIDQLGDAADIVVECAPSSQLRAIVEPAVKRGRSAVVVSVGGLLDNFDLVDLARTNGGRILVPTGALIGLDAVNAAAVGTIHSVKMVTRKPIDGLKGAPFIVQNNIDIDNLREPPAVRGQRARRGEGLSSERQCRRCAVAGGHRPRSHPDAGLGRPHGDAQCSSHRGRGGFGAVLDGYREHSVRESQDRDDHRAVRDRAAA